MQHWCQLHLDKKKVLLSVVNGCLVKWRVWILVCQLNFGFMNCKFEIYFRNMWIWIDLVILLLSCYKRDHCQIKLIGELNWISSTAMMLLFLFGLIEFCCQTHVMDTFSNDRSDISNDTCYRIPCISHKRQSLSLSSLSLSLSF